MGIVYNLVLVHTVALNYALLNYLSLHNLDSLDN